MERIRLTPIDDPAALGQRLRAARKAAGMSLRDLSFPGCTAPYISIIENGRRVPSLQMLNALADRLGVSARYLANGDTSASLEDRLVEADVALRLGEIETAEHGFARVLEEGHDKVLRARALAGSAEITLRRGEIDEAIPLLEEARELLADRFAAFPAIVESLGRAYAMRSRFESALEIFETARAEAIARGDAPAALRFATLLANTYIDVGDLAGSAHALSNALQQAGDLGDSLLRARVHWSQSRLHTVEGRHDLAAEFAHRALDALQAAEDEYSVARAHHLLAYIELERGDGESALRLLDEALPTIARNGDAYELALFELEKARAFVAVDQREEARELAERVAPALLASMTGDGGRCFIVLGDVYSDLDEDDKAIAMYDAAIETLADHRSPHLARAYRQKAAVLERMGEMAEALELLKQSLDVQAPARRPA